MADLSEKKLVEEEMEEEEEGPQYSLEERIESVEHILLKFLAMLGRVAKEDEDAKRDPKGAGGEGDKAGSEAEEVQEGL